MTAPSDPTKNARQLTLRRVHVDRERRVHFAAKLDGERVNVELTDVANVEAGRFPDGSIRVTLHLPVAEATLAGTPL